MEPVCPRADGSAKSFWSSLLGSLLLLALMGWQAWLALGMFGPYPWTDLTNDEILVSGSHPQSLYFGYLGALGLKHIGHHSVYDPAFNGAYPKTPIFDGGRIAEITLYLAGATFQPAAYKIGVVGICMLCPTLMFLAAWGAGLRWPATLASVFLAMLIWWGPHGRAALEAGEAEIFLASLAIVAHVGMLIRFDNKPGFRAWLGILVTACLGWYFQPLMVPIALPLLLIYYLSAGVKHGSWLWHGALFLAQVAALAVNVLWMIEWVNYWWLRSPLPSASNLLKNRTISTFWNASLWGGHGLRLLAVTLLASAVVGVLALHECRQRPAARLFGLGSLSLLLLAFLGISWEPLGEVGTSALYLPALWFAVIPASFAWFGMIRMLLANHVGRGVFCGMVCLLLIPLSIAREELAGLWERVTHTHRLPIGLGESRRVLVQLLKEKTDNRARILWEDRVQVRSASRWPTLLPVLTGRSYVGGLDPAGTIEHSSISFVNRKLLNQKLANWTDKQLDEYCNRYNLGWIVAWSPDVIERFRAWDGVAQECLVQDDIPGVFFTLKPREFTYTFKGKAEVQHADWHHITLKNVEPENGVVVLKFHYQAGMRAWPHRVAIERERNYQDPIDFIRLKLNAPAAVVTLTWNHE